MQTYISCKEIPSGGVHQNVCWTLCFSLLLDSLILSFSLSLSKKIERRFGNSFNTTQFLHEANLTRIKLCVKEGIRKSNIWDHFIFHTWEETMIDCSIWLVISLIQDIRKYKVYDFVFKSNHILHLLKTAYLIWP